MTLKANCGNVCVCVSVRTYVCVCVCVRTHVCMRVCVHITHTCSHACGGGLTPYFAAENSDCFTPEKLAAPLDLSVCWWCLHE